MIKASSIAGTSINEACDRVYDRALHGGSLYFDFNGVRITMRPKSQMDDNLAMATNNELAMQRKIGYLLWADNNLIHTIKTAERDGAILSIDEIDGTKYEVTIKELK